MATIKQEGSPDIPCKNTISILVMSCTREMDSQDAENVTRYHHVTLSCGCS